MKKRRHRRQRAKAKAQPVGPRRSDAARDVALPVVEQVRPDVARRQVARFEAFGRSFWVLLAAAVVAGVACTLIKGPDVARQSLAGDLDLLLFIAPRLGAAMLIAAFVQMLLPRERVAHYVSEAAGLKGIVIASVAGGLTPGGPMTSFPVVRMLRDAGTGRSALVAYITSWSTLGFQRVLNWELPLLGPEFTLLRLAASLPLPIIAGLISRWLPQPTEPPGTSETSHTSGPRKPGEGAAGAG